jgi:hypothetical protein
MGLLSFIIHMIFSRAGEDFSTGSFFMGERGDCVSIIDYVQKKIDECNALGDEPESILMSSDAYEYLIQEVNDLISGVTDKRHDGNITTIYGVPIKHVDVNYFMISILPKKVYYD